jgi:hypothetical protein
LEGRHATVNISLARSPRRESNSTRADTNGVHDLRAAWATVVEMPGNAPGRLACKAGQQPSASIPAAGPERIELSSVVLEATLLPELGPKALRTRIELVSPAGQAGCDASRITQQVHALGASRTRLLPLRRRRARSAGESSGWRTGNAPVGDWVTTSRVQLAPSRHGREGRIRTSITVLPKHVGYHYPTSRSLELESNEPLSLFRRALSPGQLSREGAACGCRTRLAWVKTMRPPGSRTRHGLQTISFAPSARDGAGEWSRTTKELRTKERRFRSSPA